MLTERPKKRLLYVPPETFEDYIEIPALNWSTLKWLSKSPAHYLHATTNGRPDTATLKRGRATHVATLEPETFAARYSVWPHPRRGKDWEEFEARMLSASVEVLKRGEAELAQTLALAVRAHQPAARYLTGCLTEQMIQWTHRRPEVNGLEGYEVACKGRLDAVGPEGIVDLKTARDGSPTGFAREVIRLEYHVQAAWYVDGYREMTGRELPWAWVVVEVAAPHVVQVYRADEETLNLGRARYRELLDLLHVCQRDNFWPGYAATEMPLQLPRWARPLDDAEDTVDPDLKFLED